MFLLSLRISRGLKSLVGTGDPRSTPDIHIQTHSRVQWFLGMVCFSEFTKLIRWWFHPYLLFSPFSPRSLGKWNPIWRAYFSKGLVQPPTSWWFQTSTKTRDSNHQITGAKSFVWELKVSIHPSHSHMSRDQNLGLFVVYRARGLYYPGLTRL